MENQKDLYQERSFLHDLGTSLNASMFIVDRLTEELREQQEQVENNPEVDRLLHHLASYLLKVDALIESRHTHLSELLQTKITNKENTSGTNSRSPNQPH